MRSDFSSYSVLLVLEPWSSSLWPVWLLGISRWALHRLGAAALRRICAVCGLLLHQSPRSALCYYPAALYLRSWEPATKCQTAKEEPKDA